MTDYSFKFFQASLSDLKFDKSISKSPGKALSAPIAAVIGWVLGSEKTAREVRLDHFLGLWDKELTVIVQKPEKDVTRRIKI